MELHGCEEILLQNLLILHRRKYKLLEEMLGATKTRSGLNEAGQPEEILAFIEARQGCMEKVDILDAEIKKLTLRLHHLAGEEGLGVSGKMIKEQQRLCLDLVEKMQEMDRRQKPKLEMQMSRFKDLREKLRLCRQTVNAFRRTPYFSESVFIDKRK
ncbi:MAG: hypothetical protein VR68_11015 [Peptococcaceae bacterium BRH_c4a]|nr:MAG: hypothetical protein VR68_11015 [Peptococcaceae bacterium BRH_c4a]